MEYPKFKVCVRCFTFNQAKYIEDAMNGFAMQQTDFPFVCCIVDDASTDGEQDVIKKYMDMHFDYSPNSVSFDKETDYAYIHYAQHKENKNCYFAVLFLKRNLYSRNEAYKKFEYISKWRDNCDYGAFCEGDDYWIDSHKLSLQVDFLDNNSDYGVCVSDFDIKNEYTGKIEKSCFKNQAQRFPSYYTPQSWLSNQNYFAPMTWVVRMSLIKKEKEYMVPSPDGTFVKMAFYLNMSKVKCLMNSTSVYRIVRNSATHNTTFKSHYNRFVKLANCQRQLVDMYLQGKDKDDTLKLINEKYYTVGLKLFVAQNNQKEINESKKWIKKRMISHQLLYLIARSKILSILYGNIYRYYLKYRSC